MTRFITSVIVITCLLTVNCVFADGPGAKLTQVAGNHEKYVEGAQGNLAMPSRDLPPKCMLAEIRAVMDSTRNAELVLRQEVGSGQEQELTRRLGELKKASRMRILHIQLKYAQIEGRTELERRIRISIEDLRRPAAPGGPRLSGRKSPPPEARSAVMPAGGSPR